jgi:predicted GTPase
MGVAAYNRGSVALSNALEAAFENSASFKRSQTEQWQRAEVQIEKLELFCREAQALFIDATDESTASGLLKSAIFEAYSKKKETKRLNSMLSECNAAHCAWVDSIRVNTFAHISVCFRRARAWNNVINYLNNGFRLPFETPPHL